MPLAPINTKELFLLGGQVMNAVSESSIAKDLPEDKYVDAFIIALAGSVIITKDPTITIDAVCEKLRAVHAAAQNIGT